MYEQPSDVLMTLPFSTKTHAKMVLQNEWIAFAYKLGLPLFSRNSNVSSYLN